MLLALWIIAGLIGLCIVFSWLPFTLYVRGIGEEDYRYYAAFYWPWRILGFGIRRDTQGSYFQLLSGSRCLFEREKRKKTRKKRKKKKKKEKKKGSFSFFGNRDLLSKMIKAGIRLLNDLLSCFRRPRLAGDIEIGFGDPAAMGIITGIIYAISPTGMMLNELRIRPNYIDVTLNGEAIFSTGAQPARILITFLKAVFYFPIGGLIKLSRQRKTDKNKEVNENGT